MQKIMIVDDDPDILITIRRIFEQEGYEVFTVDSGKDCLKELEKGFKGIILMDIMIPYMDGWSTIGEIVSRGLNEGNIISILSVKDEPEEKTEYEEYIEDYLKKPFRADELVSIVKKYFTLLQK